MLGHSNLRPGARPPNSDAARLILREELFQSAKARVKFSKKDPDSNTLKLWNKALVQVAEGWFEGPPRYALRGHLIIDGEGTVGSRSWTRPD